MRRIAPLVVDHPETRSVVIDALIRRSEEPRSLATLKLFINSLVEIGHQSPDSSRGRIVRFFQARQRKAADGDTYDHLAWAIKQLKAEFIFGEML